MPRPIAVDVNNLKEINYILVTVDPEQSTPFISQQSVVAGTAGLPMAFHAFLTIAQSSARTPNGMIIDATKRGSIYTCFLEEKEELVEHIVLLSQYMGWMSIACCGSRHAITELFY